MPQLQLTRCELEVMDVVWRAGPVTVQDVVDQLDRPLAYTTVMTTLRVLDERRGVLRRSKRGRAYIYEAAVSREDVRRSMTTDLTRRLFGGSAKALVLSLIDAETMTPADIQHVKQALKTLEESA